jgi:D-serine deaminase-like pyridoxal phosphate-dependent protein
VTSIDDLPTPALLLDRRVLQANVGRLAGLYGAAGIRHRPHIKTTKCLQVARLQRAAGVIGFTCQTRAEVELLLSDGVTDLLWAQQPVGEHRIRYAVEANQQAQVICVVDSAEVAGPLSARAVADGTTVPVVLEIDTGQGRCGVEPGRAAELADRVAGLPGLRLLGVMTHEGHVSGGAPDLTEIRRRGTDAGAALVGVADALRERGHAAGIVSVGSTPGADSAPFVPGITEARAGTYAFCDANQLALGTCVQADCALTVLTTVVSNQGREYAVVDAGLKALSGDPSVTGQGYGLPVTRDDLTLPVANEEHGFLAGPGRHALKVGERLRILPNHACGAVNMWSSYWVVDGDQVLDQWPIQARY